MCTSKPAFTVVVPASNGSFQIRIEADYFTTNDGSLYFYTRDDASGSYVAAFRDWIYVIKEG